MDLKEAGLLWVAIMVAIIWAYGMYEDAKQRHYWLGRRDGFDMHRRMINARDERAASKQADPDGYYADNN
jgi:hypothetical protein